MMAGLFFLVSLSMIFVFIGYYKAGYLITFITLILCIFMLMHHATTTLGIRLG